MTQPSHTFNRSIYKSPKEFTSAMVDIVNHACDLKSAARSHQIDRAFTEKIMLTVTQVNDCRYCSYGHTRAALKEGIPEDEIARIAAGEFGQFPEEEAAAFLFGQHYAESGGNPDPQAWQRFVEYYGEDKARQILAYIRMIMMGNLLGNTFDAFLNRITGRPAPNSSFFSELSILTMTVLGTLPVSVIMTLRMVKPAL
ncbi:carboxymuconolactone decarboxylase family protein [Chloroflexota bacterium]